MNRSYLEASDKVMEMFLEDMLKSRVCKEHKQITEHGNPFFLLILQQEIVLISTVNAHLNQIKGSYQVPADPLTIIRSAFTEKIYASTNLQNMQIRATAFNSLWSSLTN